MLAICMQYQHLMGTWVGKDVGMNFYIIDGSFRWVSGGGNWLVQLTATSKPSRGFNSYCNFHDNIHGSIRF